MAGVALRLRKSSLRSSANEKGIDSLVVRLKPIKATLVNLLTFRPSKDLKMVKKNLKCVVKKNRCWSLIMDTSSFR